MDVEKTRNRAHCCEELGLMQMEIGHWGFRVMVNKTDE